MQKNKYSQRHEVIKATSWRHAVSRSEGCLESLLAAFINSSRSTFTISWIPESGSRNSSWRVVSTRLDCCGPPATSTVPGGSAVDALYCSVAHEGKSRLDILCFYSCSELRSLKLHGCLAMLHPKFGIPGERTQQLVFCQQESTWLHVLSECSTPLRCAWTDGFRTPAPRWSAQHPGSHLNPRKRWNHRERTETLGIAPPTPGNAF